MPRAEPTRPAVEALRTLVTVIEADGVTAAARRLGVKQPVVSRKLQAFTDPKKCGAVLLERTPSGWTLTDAGQAALPAIRELIRQYDQLFEYLEGLASAAAVVRIGLGNFAAQFYLPEALARLQGGLEECQVTAEVVRGRERILGVADGRFDLAIVSHGPAQVREILQRERVPVRLKIRPLGKHPLAVIASKRSVEGQALETSPPGEFVAVERLREWELVGLDRESGIRKRLEQRFSSPGELRFLVEGGGWWSARECVRQGLGVAVVPLAILSPVDQKDLVIRRLSDRFVIEDHLIHRQQTRRGFRDRVAKALRQACEAHHNAVRIAWTA